LENLKMSEISASPAPSHGATAPKAFISHAGEDRERFAKPFASRLRAKGIDAWASFWEINLGDSLVDKIFEEGLKNCQVFIVVLSQNSVNKAWVREELDAGMVRKIEQQTRMIAVRLDGCEIPECLKHLVWQDIPDIDNYDAAFDRIVNAIFGFSDKPPVGQPPAYVRSAVLQIGYLTRTDGIIFESACRMALAEDNPLINPDPLIAALREQDVSESQIMESLEVLDNRGYIQLHRTMGPPHVDAFSVQSFGFDYYVAAAIPEFDRLCTSVARLLVQGETMSHRGIAQELQQKPFLIEHIFRLLGSRGLIKYAESIGGGLHMDAFWVSPELRRGLERA
jgi:hypothetical protein